VWLELLQERVTQWFAVKSWFVVVPTAVHAYSVWLELTTFFADLKSPEKLILCVQAFLINRRSIDGTAHLPEAFIKTEQME
jgi:hypothetical protein